MSHLLESLLDPARRAAAAASDLRQVPVRLAVMRRGERRRCDVAAAADNITAAVQALRAATLSLQRRDMSQAEDELLAAIGCARDALHEVEQ